MVRYMVSSYPLPLGEGQHDGDAAGGASHQVVGLAPPVAHRGAVGQIDLHAGPDRVQPRVSRVACRKAPKKRLRGDSRCAAPRARGAGAGRLLRRRLGAESEPELHVVRLRASAVQPDGGELEDGAGGEGELEQEAGVVDVRVVVRGAAGGAAAPRAGEARRGRLGRCDRAEGEGRLRVDVEREVDLRVGRLVLGKGEGELLRRGRGGQVELDERVRPVGVHSLHPAALEVVGACAAAEDVHGQKGVARGVPPLRHGEVVRPRGVAGEEDPDRRRRAGGRHVDRELVLRVGAEVDGVVAEGGAGRPLPVRHGAVLEELRVPVEEDALEVAEQRVVVDPKDAVVLLQ
mmetsp:Transcript_23249/g.78463  ORF Transcript_23249/g.78463 Transcript_23249/m.78463 type:complete len:346 (+) Transcript_23249:117-1154(+)